MLLPRVLTAVTLLALLFAVLYSGSAVLFLAVISMFLAGAAWEGARLFRARHPVPVAIAWTVLFIILALLPDLRAPILVFALCVAIWALRFVPALALGLPTTDSVGNRVLQALYSITVLGAFLAVVALFRISPVYLVSVMALVWVADIGAYFAGKGLGRRKLAPSISPGKSWEGVVGGWLSVLLVGALTTAYAPLQQTFAPLVQSRLGWTGFIIVLTLMVAASVVGDLFESMLKRRVEVKDSSALLPGHGGILDRIDALIPALPLAMLVSIWL